MSYTMHPIRYIDRKTNEVITENPPGEGFLKFLYHTPFGKLSLHLLVKRKILSSLYGRLMNSSNSRKKIAPFVEGYNINMDEAVKPIHEFTSFNDFFFRKLKPEARKIQEGFVSPADGKIIAFNSIKEIRNFFVKGNEFTLSSFLKSEALKLRYEESALIIIRLAPNDYHRFHFPCNGIASEPKKINGVLFSVSPYAVNTNFSKVFCENKREYTILRNNEKGEVLICPVGATMVGSIIETYTANTAVNKGDEMGYFAFGGSSIAILVNSNKIQLDEDILANTKKGFETSVAMGERIGI